MKALGLLILAPFILLIMIPIGAALFGVVAGLFGVIVGLLGAAFGVVVAFFATIFGGLFSIGGITLGVFFTKFFIVALIVGAVYYLTSQRSSSK